MELKAQTKILAISHEKENSQRKHYKRKVGAISYSVTGKYPLYILLQ
jgi:hypothetical protein